MVSYSRRQKSGHFTCYLNRTYHVLLTEKQQPLALLLCHCYCGGMARNTNNLRSLRNIIAEAHDILRTTILPEQRSQRAYELLTAAVHLADNLLEESPAAALGAKGGKITRQTRQRILPADRCQAQNPRWREANEGGQARLITW